MNRREFFQNGIGAILSAGSNSAMIGGLGLLNSMAATSNSSNSSGYKTLVMVYLNGGVDSLGLLVPTGASEYAAYKDLRQHLALDLADLINIGSGDHGTPSYCHNMVDLYDSGKLSWVSNVGPLRQPTTKAMIQNNNKVMPLFIGSHNSQTIMWQSGTVDASAREGWGARMLELLNQPAQTISPNISLDRAQLFTSTLSTPTFSINPDVIQNLATFNLADGEGNPDLDLFYSMQNLDRSAVLDRELASRNRSTLESFSALSETIESIQLSSVDYPDDLHVEGQLFQRQLKMAARLIEAAPDLGHQRQVLMVQMHAYDTHDNQDRILPGLVSSLFSNLEAFQRDLEARGLDDRVVTFSQSDFGRTPTINANGTDHGWGGHCFVMGTPVSGGQIVGQIPEFGVDTEKMVYNLPIPDFSVEQYASNLASWFGLNRSQILDVLPGLDRFEDVDFGLFSDPTAAHS